MIETFKLKVLRKKRFEVVINKTLWEIDVFEGSLSGLILAEVELRSEDEAFDKPHWLGEEVSHLASYYNANLIDRL
jgi:adenylate cyclase